MKRVDWTGRRFGRLVIQRRAVAKYPSWICLCDCGTEFTANHHSIRAGHTSSCGCLRRETAAATAHQKVTHGIRRGQRTTPEYRAWTALHNRCKNPLNKNFANYGGRGIAVSERWNSFENFLADVGHRPSSKHSIDRINNDGNYEPGNVRWTTMKQQTNNRRSNRIVVYQGISMTVQKATDLAGNVVRKGTVLRRLELGWSVEKAVEMSARPMRRVA